MSRNYEKIVERINELLGSRPQRRFYKDFYKDEPTYLRLIGSRTRLLNKIPFYGLCAMGLVLVELPEIDTLAVDGYHLYYNPEFIKTLNQGKTDFAMIHEVSHVVFDHLFTQHRIGGRNRLIWNFATDYFVNDHAVLLKYEMIPDILHDLKYRHWSSPQIYDDLKKNPDKLPQMRTFDVHLDIGDFGQPGDESGKRKVLLDGGQIGRMKGHWKKIVDHARQVQIQFDQQQKSAGNIPAGLERWFDIQAQPVFDWRDVLRLYTEQVLVYSFSYARPHKSLFQQGWTIPGFRAPDEELDIVVALDASGSINDQELSEFMTELRFILDAFPEFRVMIWFFDGDVQRDTFKVLTKDNIDEFESIMSLGRGGTNFLANWQFMDEEGIKPKLFIMFTDGEPFGDWGIPGYCDTLFVIHSQSKIVPPFGYVAYFNDGFYDLP